MITQFYALCETLPTSRRAFWVIQSQRILPVFISLQKVLSLLPSLPSSLKRGHSNNAICVRRNGSSCKRGSSEQLLNRSFPFLRNPYDQPCLQIAWHFSNCANVTNPILGLQQFRQLKMESLWFTVTSLTAIRAFIQNSAQQFETWRASGSRPKRFAGTILQNHAPELQKLLNWLRHANFTNDYNFPMCQARKRPGVSHRLHSVETLLWQDPRLRMPRFNRRVIQVVYIVVI